MADPFDDIDVGQDFEDFAVGLRPIKVVRTNPEDMSAVTTVEDVPATKLVRRRSPFSVGAGELPSDVTRFVFRADRLGFLPKAHDQITDSGGQVWDVMSAELQGFDALCSCEVVINRA